MLNLDCRRVLQISCIAFFANSCRSLPPSAPGREEIPAGTAVHSGTTAAKFVQSTVDRSRYEASASKFVVAAQGQVAAEAARDILRRGGNVMDAAVAASFAISVERPQSTGLGGGGFMLFRQAETGKIFAIDFRERAPLAATEKMYLDASGNVREGASSAGALSVAVPGLVAGVIAAHKKFGSLPLATLVEPAVRLAEEGLTVYPELEKAIALKQGLLAKHPASKAIFLKPNGDPYKRGDKLIQKDLAKTLRAIARDAGKDFYRGALARSIAAEVQRAGGIVIAADLASYEVKWREPVEGSYKGLRVVSFPPPSSGGAHVIEILNMIEGDSLKEQGHLSASGIHLVAASMQQAFADRAQFMGDPDFVKIPLLRLTAKDYAKIQRERIKNERARPANEVSAGLEPAAESSDTTHFSIMDGKGNVVLSTQTINGYLGSGIVVPGTGILLNNEMDDFSAKPGAMNIYGAVGGTANAIAPKKAPLSSMSPTLVLKGNVPVLGLGAPGGTRILTCVAQTILNYLEYELPLFESIASLRFHHQWRPDKLDLELPGPGPDAVSRLQKMGYAVELGAVPCNVNAVAREGAVLRGAADPRDIGGAYGD